MCRECVCCGFSTTFCTLFRVLIKFYMKIAVVKCSLCCSFFSSLSFNPRWTRKVKVICFEDKIYRNLLLLHTVFEPVQSKRSTLGLLGE